MATRLQRAGQAFRGAAIAGLCLLSMAWQPPARALDILVLPSDQTDLYTNFADTFAASLEALAEEGEPYRLDTVIHDPELDRELPATTGYDLVVTIGTRAAKTIEAAMTDRPVLHTLIPESVYHELDNGSDACRHTAVFIDQPISRQWRLAQALFPDTQRVGILLGPTSKQRRGEIDGYRPPAGQQAVIRLVEQEENLAQVTTRLLNEADLVLAVSDPLALNRENARWLLYAAYQRQRPVIGFSSAYVRAGAAAAVFSEPEQFARQAAAMVHEWRESGRDCLPAAGYARDFRVTINRAVCKSLGGRIIEEQELARQLQQQEQH